MYIHIYIYVQIYIYILLTLHILGLYYTTDTALPTHTFRVEWVDGRMLDVARSSWTPLRRAGRKICCNWQKNWNTKMNRTRSISKLVIRIVMLVHAMPFASSPVHHHFYGWSKPSKMACLLLLYPQYKVPPWKHW